MARLNLPKFGVADSVQCNSANKLSGVGALRTAEGANYGMLAGDGIVITSSTGGGSAGISLGSNVTFCLTVRTDISVSDRLVGNNAVYGAAVHGKSTAPCCS